MYLKEIASAALLAVYATAGQAQETEDLRESFIVTTASESILSSAALLGDYLDGPVDSFEFSGSYTNSSWSMDISALYQEQSVEISMSGFLFGSAGSDFDANYSGTGLVNGEEPILIHGNFSWDYNGEIDDYESVAVSHAMRFGENSVWGWVVGGEIVFGGALFGGAAIIGAPATGGGSLIIGGAAAIGGANAAVLLSKHARDVIESDTPTEPPAQPDAPELPEPGIALSLDELGENISLVAITNDGQIIGQGPAAAHRLNGEYSHDSGVMSGEIIDIIN